MTIDRCSTPACSVLSLAAGPVLGAFLVGVLTTRVGSAAMLGGMIAGQLSVTRGVVDSGCAWTWYALLGAAVTSVAALALSTALPRQASASHA